MSVEGLNRMKRLVHEFAILNWKKNVKINYISPSCWISFLALDFVQKHGLTTFFILKSGHLI